MGQFRDVTIKEVVEEINQSYFLPDIQREYVWLNRDKERKIEQLFDSVLRNYPIGSFLFWKLKKTDIETNRLAQSDEDKLNFQLYKFLEEYDIRKPHNEKIDIAKVNTSDLTIVLDGQQRLTSLYIGLKGSRTLKKPKGWWENPNSFEAKKLYLNLRYKPADNDAEDCYDFEFKNPSYIPEPDEKNYWFRVGEILEIDSVIKYCRDHSLSDAEADILEKLKNVLCVERLISYYEEREKNLDKVLKIFIRVNSGGTQLSYSDLLMSILTANFSSDIRDVMNSFVDKIREDGFPCFGRDQLLKTCLLLTGANHKFALKNFRKANVEAIEAAWPSIMDRICEALSIVKGFGYSRQLASGYIVSVIALYLYNSEKSIKDIDKVSEEREAIWDFVRLAQITSYFSTSLDSKLSNVVECMAETLSFVDFKEKMARLDANKALKLTSEDVEDLLTVQYGSPAALPVLQMLYPHLDYKNSTFHVDHIYPKSKFTPRNKYLDPKHYEERNYLVVP
ncbi:DUF262 domain-containing protein [Porphyromonas gulae]|uniref:DUF262 domain-containing protein n=1 Tax=Porphyromonas gulae TaxID=111105 RepID=UPI0026F07E91|nr:DUF262 domain-containing protein [Porphyromonas gulae]